MARSRNLSDVLHFYISEDEQSEAREEAARSRSAPAPSAWAMPVERDRLLAAALALEIASALAGGGRAEVLAPFSENTLAPRIANVRWRPVAGERGALARALGRATGGVLVVAPAPELAAWLREARSPRCLLLPLSAAPSAETRSLEVLHALAQDVDGFRVASVVIGARSRDESAALASRFAAAARRRHGVEVESLGELFVSAANYRAILHGESVRSGASGGAEAHSLTALGRALGRVAA